MNLPVRALAGGLVAIVGGLLPVLPAQAALATPPAWSTANLASARVQQGLLDGVSCTASNRCVAVGSYTAPSGNGHMIVNVWNGKSWLARPISNPGKSSYAELLAVSCARASSCKAVGTYANRAGTDAALVESWNGRTWRPDLAPDPAGATGAFVTGVTCTSTTFCVAVGNYDETGEGDRRLVSPGRVDPPPPNAHGLIELWKGKAWTVHTAPSPADAEATYLTQVTCTSTTRCLAVGSYVNASGSEVALAESWNGTTWATMTTPTPKGSTYSELAAVRCVTPAKCEAVGADSGAGGGFGQFGEAWNGSAWAIQKMPSPGGFLTGLSCVSVKACWAAGNAGGGTLVEYWNGKTWAVQPTPNPRHSVTSYLQDVSCVSTTDCHAVGEFTTTTGGGTTAMSWNGTAWTLESSPA